MRRKLAGALAALALPITVSAATLTETDFLVDLPVVLSASRLSQPLTHTPAAVTIIDQDMISASGFRDIPDLLRLVPGFTVAYTDINTWGVGYHGMADAFSRRMQVLVDGRSVYLPGFGQVQWNYLPLSIEDIDHIEVVRGPNAAAYGANAFFGVINIITKDPLQVQGMHASGQVGGQNNHGALVRYGGSTGDFRYRLSLFENWRDRFDTHSERTDTKNLDFRGEYNLSNTDEVTVNIGLSRAQWRWGYSDDVFNPVRDDANAGGEHFQVKFRRVTDEHTEWSLQFYHTRDFLEDSYLVPGDFLVDFGQQHWRDDLEFEMINTLNDKTRMVWGAEARWEGVDASKWFFYGMDARTGAMQRLFGNIEWMPEERWIINGGIMAERHYYTGMDFSPRLAVNYLVSPDHSFRASIGQAYRSPTFFEVEGYNPYAYAPNGDLQPEKVLSREIGYIGHVHSLNLDVDTRLFSDRVRKIIGDTDIDPGPTRVLQNFNMNFANIRGADIQLKWRPVSAFDLIMNFARVHIDSSDNDISNSSPKNNFSALAMYRLPEGWEASMGVYKTGTMKWIAGGDTTKAFTRVDARLARKWKLHGHPVELSIVGQDLANERYAEELNTNLFGRRAYVGVSFDW